MTNISQLRALYFSVAMFAAVFVAMMTQVIMQVINQGLSDSASVRVSSATACEVSKDGAHFTGCSSIL